MLLCYYAGVFWSLYLVFFVLAKKGEHKESFLNHNNKIREYVSRKHVPNEKCFDSFFSPRSTSTFFLLRFLIYFVLMPLWAHIFSFRAFIAFYPCALFCLIEISSKAIAIGVIEKTEWKSKEHGPKEETSKNFQLSFFVVQ